MPLETTIICVDNSEWTRNGDYIPTRFEAQHDAVNLVTGAKTQQNPESTVGVLTMAGRGVELLVSPTDDIGKLLSCLHSVRMGGRVDMAGAVQVAQLALKHRRNKNGSQRVVVFVCSPVEADAKTLVKVGKQLKKNGIAVDVVSLGEIEENQEKLQEFVEATNSNNNSHLVSIPAGFLPSDVLVTSPIIHGGEEGSEGAGMGAGAGGGGAGFGGTSGLGDFGGVDAQSDPALAMALRVSYEEERARQEAAAKAAAATEGENEGEAKGMAMETEAGASSSGTAAAAAASMGGEVDEEEEALLKQALAMSMADSGSSSSLENKGKTAASGTGSGETAGAGQGEGAPMEMEDEDAAYQLALKMSMEEEGGGAGGGSTGAATGTEAGGEASSAAPAAPTFADPEFVMNLLGSLEGVDPNDPTIRATLESMGIKPPGTEERKDGEGGGGSK